MDDPGDSGPGRGINVDPRDRHLAEIVWDLHLAFAVAAATDPSLYTVSPQTADQIRDYAEHREVVLALDLILACGSLRLPPGLIDEAQRVAQLIYDMEPTAEVNAYVNGWLRWHLGCGVDPPSWV